MNHTYSAAAFYTIRLDLTDDDGAAATATVPTRVVGGVFATGTDAGVVAQVNVFDSVTGQLEGSLFPFGAFTGGVRVAAGDVNGDGTADIVCGAGAGGGPQVSVFDGANLSVLESFFAFPLFFTGGVYVAAGDLAGTGRAEVVAGAGAGGGPEISLFGGSGGQLLASLFAADPRPTDVLTLDANAHAGVRVSTTPLPRHAAILTTPRCRPQTAGQEFDGLSLTLLDRFYAFGPNFHDGAIVGG